MAEHNRNKRAPNFQDLTGKRYGKLTVVGGFTGGKDGKWQCSCDCGRVVYIRPGNLRRNLSRSCGCSKRTRAFDVRREYKSWHAAMSRCSRPHTEHYARYGGRGITICDAWALSFDQFIADMGPCPPGLTLDRIDNDGPYSPENCRWASRRDQQKNRRITERLTYDGVTLTVKEWSRRTGQGYTTILRRIRQGTDPFTRQRKPKTPRKHLKP